MKSRRRLRLTAPRNPRIRIVQESEATGETKAIYDEIRARSSAFRWCPTS